MAAEKTEKATPKKRRDAARRGQSFKARDLVVALLLFCSVLFVVWLVSLAEIGMALVAAIRGGFSQDLHRYAADVLLLGLKVVAPIVVVSIAATALPSLLQSGFTLAPESFTINFNAINPIKGFKKIFSLRTAKDFIKTLLYMVGFGAAILLFWWLQRKLIFAQVHSSIPEIIIIWDRLLISLVLTCLVCVLVILIVDALAELFLYLKDLRMDRQEIKREYKENEGDPLIKSKRKQAHMELLSAQDKHNIENSRMVIANPTHLAIGIYFKPELTPVPFVSIREGNQRALGVRHYAKKVGVPVIVDVPLARRLYRSHYLYDRISLKEIHTVARLLLWLEQVERAGSPTVD